MHRSTLCVIDFWIRRLCALLLFVACAAAASGQQLPAALTPPPRIGYAYPAGGRAGTTFQVVLGGQYLSDAAEVTISGPGAKVRVLDLFRPLTQQEFGKLRDRADVLRDKAGIPKDAKGAADIPPGSLAKLTDEERAELREIRMRLLEGNPRRITNPAISETLLLEVTLDADVVDATRELRLRTTHGLSNPLVFRTGTLPEALAHPVQLKPDERTRRSVPADKQRAVSRTETSVTLPAVVNGQILQGGVDRVRFHATKGQHIVVSAEARALIPYLADAVPGWFQATLTCSDAKGRELAYNDDFRFSPDPVLCVEIPADGDYTVDIKDAIFRGREDFVYRLTLGELPFVTGMFPAGGPAGGVTQVALSGWNLPATHAQMDGRGRPPGHCLLSLRGFSQSSAPLPFELSETPEYLEHEGNDTPATAEQLTLPCVVNGRIGGAGDKDWFRFSGRAGQELVAEVRARRLGSPVDSQLRLYDSQGHQLAFNDDHEDKAAGLQTHHADSLVQLRLPADGTYLVELSDVQHQGGEANVYRLHLRAPQPDFELRTDASALNVREGEPVPLTVYALRRDGFTGPIDLHLVEVGEGVQLEGGRIPAGVDKVRVTLTVQVQSRPEPYRFRVEGWAKLPDGSLRRRSAVPADDMMQAFAYRHLVQAQGQYLEVLPRAQLRPRLRLREEGPLALPLSGETRLFIPVAQRRAAEGLRFELSDPPAGLSLKGEEAVVGGVELTLLSDPQKLKPGLEGNLIVSVGFERSVAGQKKENGKPKQVRRIPLGYLPAIPFITSAPEGVKP